jgi:hypothetical protein
MDQQLLLSLVEKEPDNAIPSVWQAQSVEQRAEAVAVRVLPASVRERMSGNR